MKTITLTLVLALAAACGSDDDGPADITLNSATAIQTYLDAKTWLMVGTNIPSHPNGSSEDTNFGASSQCYQDVSMLFAAGNVTVTSRLGAIDGTTMAGQTGTCNHTATAAPLAFTSTNILIENVQGNADCFDFTATYTTTSSPAAP
jgi:hypothetical protein